MTPTNSPQPDDINRPVPDPSEGTTQDSPPREIAPPKPAGQLVIKEVRKARLNINQMAYHTPAGGTEQAQRPFHHKWSLWLESDEQPHGPRTITVGEDWIEAPLGWVSEVGAIVIGLANLEGIFRHKVPTKEEKDEAAAKLVEVGQLRAGEVHITPTQLLRPLTSIQVFPLEDVTLYLRCRKGKAKVSVTAFPK